MKQCREGLCWSTLLIDRKLKRLFYLHRYRVVRTDDVDLSVVIVLIVNINDVVSVVDTKSKH